MKKILKATALVIILLFITNAVVWISFVKINVDYEPREIYKKGLVLRFGSAVFVFGHGSWETDEDYVVKHITYVENRVIPTDSLISDLKKQGANYIWMSACHAGDYNFMVLDRFSGKKIPWPKEVSRSDSGNVIPIWVLFGLQRINYGTRSKIDTSRILFKPITITIYLNPDEYIAAPIKVDYEVNILDEKDQIVSAVKNIAPPYQWPEKITFLKKTYFVRGVKISKEIGTRQLNGMIQMNTQRLEARGWKKGKSYPIHIEIQPIIYP